MTYWYDDDELFSQISDPEDRMENEQEYNQPELLHAIQPERNIANEQEVLRPRRGNTGLRQGQENNQIPVVRNANIGNNRQNQNNHELNMNNRNRNNRNRRARDYGPYRHQNNQDGQRRNNNNNVRANLNNRNQNQTQSQIPPEIAQTLSQIQNNANTTNFENFYEKRQIHHPPPDPLLTQVSLNTNWTPTFSQEAQTPQIQLQNIQPPQVNLITQGKNTYKVLQPPKAGLNNPHVPTIQVIPEVYNMYNKIPNGQDLTDFQKAQALNKINTQEIERHRQLYNQELMKRISTLNPRERQEFVKSNPHVAQAISQVNNTETINQKRRLIHQASWTSWHDNQIQMDKDPPIAQNAEAYWVLQSLQNKGYTTLEQYNQNALLTKQLKQTDSALPDYLTSVRVSDKPGEKEKKEFIGLRNLYKIKEEDEKTAETLFRQYQVKKIQDIKKLSEVKLHKNTTTLQYATIRMMALVAIKSNLYLMAHLNKVIGQYNLYISAATDPKIHKEQAKRTLMMTANVDHMSWATNILLNEEMLKDDPKEETLLEFIRPYFEEYHMKDNPLHPERKQDCF